MDKVFLEKYQQELLSSFKTVVSFLNRKDIKWIVLDGTCLGAVRHQGMIPWDDDIDIGMNRNEIQKLLKDSKELKQLGYSISTPYEDNSFTPFFRIYNLNTTIWGRPGFFTAHLWIDIFPLDKTSKSQLQYEKGLTDYLLLKSKWLRSIEKTPLREYLYLFSRGHWGGIVERIVNTLYYNHKSKYFHSKFIQQEQRFNEEHGHHYVIPTDTLGSIEYFPCEWFDNRLLVPFENFEVYIPQNYNEYLSTIYGDYMTPPPIEKRINTHNTYYVNLKENIKKEEIRRRLKTGEEANKDYVCFSPEPSLIKRLFKK